MYSKKACIGWYCPFVYPAIVNAPNIALKQIPFEQEQNISFASVKLCRKLSAVRREITSGALDGIIMVNCCNLARHMYDLFVKEHGRLPVFLLEIPRKNSERCKNIILKQYVLIKEWLLSLGEAESRIRNKTICENNCDDILNNSGSPKENNLPKPDWCCLPQDFNEALPADEMLSNLLKENVCPRLLQEGHFSDNVKNRLSACNATEPDMFCTVRSYLSAEQAEEGIYI